MENGTVHFVSFLIRFYRGQHWKDKQKNSDLNNWINEQFFQILEQYLKRKMFDKLDGQNSNLINSFCTNISINEPCSMMLVP
jgi:hypothetical protein